MRSCYSLMICLCLLLSGAAFSHGQTLYDLLHSVNREWSNPAIDHSFRSESVPPKLNERQIIQLHLLSVEQVLRRSAADHLTDEQKRARAQNLERLKTYRQAGAFPRNYTHQDRIPVFVDPGERICAVGYLLQQDRQLALIDLVRHSDNNVRIRDIDNRDFDAWQAQSGLALEELALIQPFYKPFISIQKASLPWECRVTAMLADEESGQLFVAGRFRVGPNNWWPAVAVFHNDSWSINMWERNGSVHALSLYKGQLHAAGRITVNIATKEQAETVVKWTGAGWQRVGAIRFNTEVSAMKVYQDKLYASSAWSTDTDTTGNGPLAVWNGQEWQQVRVEPMAAVHAMEVYRGSLYIAGHVTDGDSGKNAMIQRIDGIEGERLDSPFETTIYSLEVHAGHLYAGGRIIRINDNKYRTCLAYFDGVEWTDRSAPYQAFEVSDSVSFRFTILFSVADLLHNNSETLFIASIEENSDACLLRATEPVVDGEVSYRTDWKLSLPGAIKSITNFGSSLYFGGSVLTHPASGDSVGLLVAKGAITDVRDDDAGFSAAGSIDIRYSANEVFVTLPDALPGNVSITVYDLAGQTAAHSSRFLEAPGTQYLRFLAPHLARGAYLLEVKNGLRMQTGSFIVSR